jgi:hypothetical protein
MEEQLYTTLQRSVIDSIAAAERAMSRSESNVDNLARCISRFSPYGCLQNLCVTLANTDMQRELDLRASAEEHDYGTFDFYVDFMEQNGDLNAFYPLHGPAFVVRSSSLMSAVERSSGDICILVLMGMIALMVGFVGFVRMDIA